MDSILKLLPNWNDFAFQDMVKLKSRSMFSNLKPPDHGGMGVDIAFREDNLHCEISKHGKNQNSFAAQSCALPFFPYEKIQNMSDLCIEPMKKERLKHDKFCLKLNFVRSATKCKKYEVLSELKVLRKRLKSISDSGNYDAGACINVRHSIVDLANNLPKHVIVPTCNAAYAGGNLALSKSFNKLNLLHPSCEDLNKLCITPLNDKIYGHFQPSLSEQVTISLENEPILQVESVMNGFCCIRQKSKYHLLNIQNMNVISKTEEKSLLHHIASSPYNPLEVLSVYDKGVIKLRNMETGKYIWGIHDFNNEDHSLIYSTWKCNFGSHPFSALSMNEKCLYLLDFREQGCKIKELFSVRNPCCSITEEFVSLKYWNRNPFQHFLASNEHLLICDERYPKTPVMSWNHTLKDSPMYCDIADFHGNTNSAVIIGTQETRELSAFFLNSLESQINPVSLGPPLGLSSPSDCINSLKLQCHPVNENISSRFSYPLCGICIVPYNKETAFTVFQITSIGDVFYQDFKQMFNKVDETSYQVNTGCILTPSEKILPCLKDWISSNDSNFSPEPVEESVSRILINVSKILDMPKKISANCSLCRLSYSTYDKDIVLSEVCPTCNLSSTQSQHFSTALTNLTVISGPGSKDAGFIDCDIDYLSQFTDPYSKRMLNVWMESIDHNEVSSQTAVNADINMETAVDTLPSTLDISTHVIDPARLNEKLSIHVDSQIPMESSLDAFVMDNEGLSEFVPSSQEVRPLVGETLLTPLQTKLKSKKLKISSTAGF